MRVQRNLGDYRIKRLFGGRWTWRKEVTDACAPELGPLMYRYYLIDFVWFGLYVHKFLRSDNDRHVHDHPWSFITFTLGAYWEHLPDGTVHRRSRFSLLFRPAEWQHWVEIRGGPVWTIVFRFSRRRVWGFLTERGWTDWQTYGRENCE